MARASGPDTTAESEVTPLDRRGRSEDHRQISPLRIPSRGAVGYSYPEGFSNYSEGEILTHHVVE